MKNAIFTIVSNNYYARALTLIKSIKTQCVDADIFLCLADEKLDTIDYHIDGFTLLCVTELECDNLVEMKFKYDITEFNTAIKPFAFKMLLEKYERVLYLDPDIYVFDSLRRLFSELDENSIILTPHLCCADICRGKEHLIESEISSAGIFNLGFCGVKRSAITDRIIPWWCNKLQDCCFVDYRFGQFYDQKWMNFIPVLAGKELKILKEPGYNFAPWNFCERKLISQNNQYYVEDREGNISELFFMHFSGFNPQLPDYLNQQHLSKFDISPNVRVLLKMYFDELQNNNNETFAQIPYFASKFDNGDRITSLHRQLYRSLLDMNIVFDAPFAVGKGSLHALLKKKKLLDNHKEINKRSQVANLHSKMKKANKIMKFIKNLLGVRRYTFMLRYFQYTSQLKNQTFLLGYNEDHEKND